MLTPLSELPRIRNRQTHRASSWDRTGRNADAWTIEPGQARVLADIPGPGTITHIWMTQVSRYRECLLRVTWDDVPQPSVLCPLGDFFCLGHGIVNSFQSLLFTASTHENLRNKFNQACALNCYAPMPFRSRALVELVNESREPHGQYFYIDYESGADALCPDAGYFHAEFRRANPFGGWAHEICDTAEANAANTERQAWASNYVILETSGRGQYIGCNLSVTNFQGTWWGEGDDMIWVDGYKWPPDLHGTGSEDHFNQAWGMQRNAFLRNGSSIFEHDTGGYQTSYVFHVENPVRFQESLKVTIEHGHANQLANEMSSVAYWYAERPGAAAVPPELHRRMPVLRDNRGTWLHDTAGQTTPHAVQPTAEMVELKRRAAEKRRSSPTR